MITISKKFKIEYAHQLMGHQGKCAQLHGHSGTIEVYLSGERQNFGSSMGMVMDYGDLKELMKPIIDRLDHRFLANGDEPICDVPDYAEQITLVHVRTTAENLCKWILNEILRKSPLPVGVREVGVRFSETESSWAESWETV